MNKNKIPSREEDFSKPEEYNMENGPVNPIPKINPETIINYGRFHSPIPRQETMRDGMYGNMLIMRPDTCIKIGETERGKPIYEINGQRFEVVG